MASRLYDPNFALNFEVINVGWTDPAIDSKAKIGREDNPFRFTNIVFLMGDEGRDIKLKGVFNLPFSSVGAAWTSSSGGNPLPTLQAWERLGTLLTLEVDNGTSVITMTSVNIVSSRYSLLEGLPFGQTNIRYDISVLESIY